VQSEVFQCRKRFTTFLSIAELRLYWCEGSTVGFLNILSFGLSREHAKQARIHKLSKYRIKIRSGGL